MKGGSVDPRADIWRSPGAVARAPPIIRPAMRNQLRPLFDRVVIKELDPDRVRRSGLLVPPGPDEPPPQHGIVLERVEDCPACGGRPLAPQEACPVGGREGSIA